MDDKAAGKKRNGEDPTLDDLVQSVSDGDPVDWTGVASREGLAEITSIRALREVSRIADFNRALQRSPRPGSFSEETAGPGSWGSLTLLEQVGTGTTGEVWRAWDPKLQRQVALKFLQSPAGADPLAQGTQAEGAKRLLDEARALARVRHPGVVVVHGIDEQEGRTGMWMEFLHGRTLAEEIERRGAFSPGDLTRIGIELSEALDAVHGAGVVHRDLKPANIILEADGRAVLADFGLGLRRSADRPGTSGTPVFMSPGVLAGEPASPQSDIYALGVTLRWALTGKAPFKASSLEALKEEAAVGPARSILDERPDTPPEFAAILDRAMAPKTGDRFGSAGEMAKALRGIAGGSASPPVGRPSSKRGMTLIAATIGMLLIGAWFVSRPAAPPLESAPGSGSASAPEAGSVVGTPVEAAPTNGIATPEVFAAYDVQATLVNRSDGKFITLSPGDRVRPGDRLSLQFTASKPMWVYVLNEDETGETYLLFPQPSFDLSNPVEPGSAVLLPGTVGGQENAWTVTSQGGREHFLIVASLEPVAEIEADLAKLPAVKDRPVQYAAIRPATVERLRGVGGVSPLPGGAVSRASGAFERFQALAGRETVTSGPWVRKITLENPIQ